MPDTQYHVHSQTPVGNELVECLGEGQGFSLWSQMSLFLKGKLEVYALHIYLIFLYQLSVLLLLCTELLALV